MLAGPVVSELTEMDAAVTHDTVEDIAWRLRQLAQDAPFTAVYLGRQPFRPIWDLQRRLHGWRARGELDDIVLLVEHEPVYTLGKHARREHLLNDRPAAEVVTTDRGGGVTYHGPGQLVGYPIINLKDHRPSVSWYMRGLEQVMIRTLATYDLPGQTLPGLTGVWIHEQKVAALGVRLSRWTTMHGFALNIAVPPVYFAGIIPCGSTDYGNASLNDFGPVPSDVALVANRLTPFLQEFLGTQTFL